MNSKHKTFVTASLLIVIASVVTVTVIRLDPANLVSQSKADKSRIPPPTPAEMGGYIAELSKRPEYVNRRTYSNRQILVTNPEKK